jgi:hypothetical protein
LQSYDVAKMVQFGRGKWIATSDDRAIHSRESSGADVRGVGSARVEASLGHVQANRLKISARGTPGAQAEIENELVSR